MIFMIRSYYIFLFLVHVNILTPSVFRYFGDVVISLILCYFHGAI